MNFGLSFSYVFKDEAWFKKLLLPALCMLIPIVGWMVSLGWALKVTKNLIDGVEDPLPNLSFGDDLGRGFFAFLISFIYTLPASMLQGINSWITSPIFSSGDGAGIANGLVIAITIILGLLGTILSIIGSFIATVAIANYVAKGDFAAAFQLGEIFNQLKTHFVDWLLVLVGIVLGVGIIGPLGTIACIIGVILTMTYGLAIMGHLMGQAYNRSNPVVHDSNVITSDDLAA